MSSFGDFLEKKGITGYRLAKSSGVSQAVIARLVTGERDVRFLKLDTGYKIAKVLDISLEELLELSDKKGE